LILVLCLFSLITVDLVSLVQAAVPWTKYAGDLTLRDGTFDELYVSDAWVVKNSDTDYEMWYTHSNTNMDIDEMVSRLTSFISVDLINYLVFFDFNGLLNDFAAIADSPSRMDALWNYLVESTSVIGYATSSNGIDWAWDATDDPVLAGAGSLESFGKPCIIKDGGIYEMWFTRSEINLDKAGLRAILADLDGDTNTRKTAILALLNAKSTTICYTSSNDGINWVTPTLDVLTGTDNGIWDGVSSPSVIKNSTSDYDMWFTYAQISLDETGLETILNDIGNDTFEPSDLRNLLEDIQSSIGYATATDGTDWGISGYNVFVGGGGVQQSIFEHFTSDDNNGNFGGSYWRGQTFTPAISHTLNLVKVKLSRYPGYTAIGDVEFAIYATDGSGLPTGSAISTGSMPVIDIPTVGYFVYEITMDPVVVTAGTKYAIIFSAPSMEYGSMSYAAKIPSDDSDYAGGTLVGSTNSGTSWFETADRRAYFEEWGIASIFGDGTGLWNSETTPCVIDTGSNYEMWYSHPTTDLDLAGFEGLISTIETLEPDILDLIDSYQTGGIDAFLLDLEKFLGEPGTPGDIDPILPYLDQTSTIIGYATSIDGVTWSEQNPSDLVGSSGGPWSSVGSPCVIWEGGKYQMWFTQGVDYPSAQNLVSLIDGSILPIGYATSLETSLVAGWNFIGLTLTPSSTAIEDVLADIIDDVGIVWHYDGATTTWYYFIPNGPQTLTDMTEGKGYWIDMTAPTNLIVPGTEPAYPYDIDLVISWNLISLPGNPSSTAIEDVLADIIDDVGIVWHYDGATTTWYYFIPNGPQTLTDMTEGKAYWIEMIAPNTLTIDVN
jgi:hypothetical protein